MADTVLQICQDAADELKYVRPSASNLFATTASDLAPRQLLRSLHKTCKELARDYDWQRLRREKTFVTVATAAQTTATPIPVDFQRFVASTVFNRTQTRRVLGPLTPDEWQAHQASLTARVYQALVIRGGVWLMAPTPAAGETIAYEYITTYIGTDTTAATERSRFSVATDLTYFDDDLLVLGIVWRQRKADGLDYAEEFRDYQAAKADMIKMDGGKRILDMSEGTSGGNFWGIAMPDTLVF